MGETSAQAALERLAALRDAGDEVALIICYESMRAMPGSELLARTRSAHPDAKRILLIDYGDQRMLQVIAHGMALGHVEYYLTKPWRPRQHLLYPVVGEALVAWTRLNSPGFELVRIVGDHWDPVSFELRDALESSRVPYGFYDRDSAEGAELLGQLDEVPDNPVIFLADGRVLTSYTRAEIAEAVGAPVRPKLDAYDLVVAGAGPAGLSAAVYGASEGLSTLVLESTAMGGQAGTSSRIRNFLGFPAGISGSELAERARTRSGRNRRTGRGTRPHHESRSPSSPGSAPASAATAAAAGRRDCASPLPASRPPRRTRIARRTGDRSSRPAWPR
jgi:thioredoxin reductase (NADPH)